MWRLYWRRYLHLSLRMFFRVLWLSTVVEGYDNFSVHLKNKTTSLSSYKVTHLDSVLNSLVLNVLNVYFTVLSTSYWRFWGCYMRAVKDLPPLSPFRLEVCNIQVEENFFNVLFFPHSVSKCYLFPFYWVFILITLSYLALQASY